MSTENSNLNNPLLVVCGEKVGLGPLQIDHRQIYLDYMSDPEIALFAGGSFRVRAQSQLQEMWDQLYKEENNFAIYDLAEAKMVGTTSLRRLNHANGTATFGIEIGFKDYWNKGLGTEATKLVLDYGFRFLNLYNISLTTFSFNSRAIRSYQKAGFKEIGRRRGAILLDGQRYDDVYMDCVVNEFEAPGKSWLGIIKS